MRKRRKFEVWIPEHIADEFDKLYGFFYTTRAETLRAAVIEKNEKMKQELENSLNQQP